MSHNQLLRKNFGNLWCIEVLGLQLDRGLRFSIALLEFYIGDVIEAYADGLILNAGTNSHAHTALDVATVLSTWYLTQRVTNHCIFGIQAPVHI